MHCYFCCLCVWCFLVVLFGLFSVVFFCFFSCYLFMLNSYRINLGGACFGCALFHLIAVFVGDLMSFFLLLQKPAVDMRANILCSWPNGAPTYLLFVPARAILSHYAHPHHSWVSMHLTHCVCAICCACRVSWDHGHKCVGSAQVCLPACLVFIFVREGCCLLVGALSLTLNKCMLCFAPFLNLNNFFTLINSNFACIFS